MRIAVILGAALCSPLLGGCGFNFGFENDAGGFGGDSDRNYTNGFRIQANVEFDEEGSARLLGGDTEADGGEPDVGEVDVAVPEGWREGTARDVAPWLDLFDLQPTDDRRPARTVVGLALGQHIYTPNDLDVGDDGKKDPIIQDDRPYAGWLYVGFVRYEALMDVDDERRRDTQVAVELDIGVTGEPSLAEQTQTWFHDLIDSEEPQGWDNQVDFEPGLLFQVSRKDRWYFGGDPDEYGGDLVSHATGQLGNIRTTGELAALGRWGFNLPRDWGPSPIETGVLGTPGDEDWSWYLYGGVAGRLVLRDIFLDGNSFSNDGHSVPKEHLVGETRLGAAVSKRGMTVAYTRVKRSREFTRQDDPHVFGSLTLSWSSRF